MGPHVKEKPEAPDEASGGADRLPGTPHPAWAGHPDPRRGIGMRARAERQNTRPTAAWQTSGLGVAFFVSTDRTRIPYGVPSGHPLLLAGAAPKQDPAGVKIAGDEEGNRVMAIRNGPPAFV